MPAHGSGLAGGINRPAPEVDAPYGTPLKMYTPSRSYPRTRPALVSATVAPSEATTLRRPPRMAGGVRDGREAEDSPNSFCGSRAEPANPAHDAAMTPSKARLPLEKDWRRSLPALSPVCLLKPATA